MNFTNSRRATALATLALAISIPSASARAQVVDLTTWSVESEASFEAFAFDEPFWQLSLDRRSVIQLQNPNPSFFYSNFDVEQAHITAELRVEAGSGDDDWIGFALGFDPGERRDANADFLFLDWKRQDQVLNNLPTTKGLAVSRVLGIATPDEFRIHDDFPSNPAGGVFELARGTTLGSVGWEFDRTYVFEFVILPGLLRVFVDGQLEIELAGSFDHGRFACYNFSQAGMSCGNVTVEALAPPTVPLDGWNDESYRFGFEAPGSWLVSADARSAEQLNRNDASIFYSDFSILNDVVVAELVSVDNSDDDFMGFVLGFDPGETQDANAEYLVIDWKSTTQSGAIGGEPFTAEAGLAISRVVGLPSVAELFGHHDHATSPAGGVTELARGANLGGVGWNVGSRYVFSFEVTPTSLQVWVEDTTRADGPRLEFDLSGDFAATAGRFGCFSNSQPRVECGNVTRVPLD